MAQLRKFCVITRRFANRAFDRGNIRHLRADMKMNELEAMREARVFQHLAGGDQTSRVETELRVLTSAGRPFARTFAMQADANADDRLDADFFRGLDGLLELLEFFNNDNAHLANIATQKRNSNER